MRLTNIIIKQNITPREVVELSISHKHYLTNVLRKKEDDIIIISSPSGYFSAKIIKTNEHEIAILILEKKAKQTNSHLNIHLFQSICQQKKMDLIVQKTTELGINIITPISTSRSKIDITENKYNQKIERLKVISENACQQSQRNIVPIINSLTDITKIKTKTNELNIMLSPNADKTLTSIIPETTDINILIGPEGGLSKSEEIFLQNNNFISVKFGPRILRTETAAIAITSAINAIWGDCC
ncbi:MAG: 16S rRNA (uracil(1498)-N(3))-methyltransferase [Legionellales bacterium]|jgi:16S rRNA (uracil1498-N3)-methyltransferase|nr:16S rRNA (uracil(1498)-N(3))-methyltransferase [Legionellales bacterium]